MDIKGLIMSYGKELELDTLSHMSEISNRRYHFLQISERPTRVAQDLFSV